MHTAPYCLAFVDMLAASRGSRTQRRYIIRAEKKTGSVFNKVGKKADRLIKIHITPGIDDTNVDIAVMQVSCCIVIFSLQCILSGWMQ
jgi:hypothetical protein